MLGQVAESVLPGVLHAQVLEHARRKLRGSYVADEEQLPKAYSLVGGRLEGHRIDVTHVFPLRRNLRSTSPYKAELDRILKEHAVASETPLEHRWVVADPREVLAAEAEDECAAVGRRLVGGYHIHRVPWQHEHQRDACTETRHIPGAPGLGHGTRMLILSMVDPARPVLRAFFEGANEQEGTVRVVASGPLSSEAGHVRVVGWTTTSSRALPRARLKRGYGARSCRG